MNFKKLSVLAIAVASFAAHADNLIADMADYTIATNKSALVAGAVPDTGNAAYVLQDNGSGSLSGAIAYISQTGGVGPGNLAAIMQGDDQSLAMIYQSGEGNKAVIASKFGADAGATGTRTGVDITISQDTAALAAVAAAELADVPAAGLSEISNVALITQSGVGATNTAYIDIVGSNNFAAIAQTAATAANLAVVSQVGTYNRAAIIQSN